MEISNLVNAEFKTLAIRMLKKLMRYFNSIKKTQAEMKVTLREIKIKLQGTNSESDEDGIQINNLGRKEEISIQPEQQEETRIQKTKERIQRLWDISKCMNIRIKGVPEREKEEQEIENLFENNERKLPQSGEGNRYSSPGSSRESQRRWTQRGAHQDKP